jgi:hypothetical protein
LPHGRRGARLPDDSVGAGIRKCLQDAGLGSLQFDRREGPGEASPAIFADAEGDCCPRVRATTKNSNGARGEART